MLKTLKVVWKVERKVLRPLSTDTVWLVSVVTVGEGRTGYIKNPSIPLSFN
jgi:hypothetical protein